MYSCGHSATLFVHVRICLDVCGGTAHYRMLTEMRNINQGHMRFYYAIGWGIPAIITGIE